MSEPLAELPDAYYLPTGEPDEFESTAATSSPWDLTQQHGGPPAALLGRAIDQTTDDPDLRVARITVDMLGAIPQGRIRTEAEVVRPGKRVEMVTARLFAEDRVAVTATAWRVRRTRGATADLADAPDPLPALPEAGTQTYFPQVDPTWGYGRSIDWRFVTGGLDGLSGHAQVWTRLRIPLVAGEPISPLSRVLVVADSANGLSIRTPIDEWWSIPSTCSVTLDREPTGEWVWMDARTRLGPDGRGVAEATMADDEGRLALVAQPLLVARRG